MINTKIRQPDRVVLHRLDNQLNDVSGSDKVVQVLRKLPKINGDGHAFLELVVNLTPKDTTEIIRQLKADNPGAADILKTLGYWYSKDDKHHIRHTLICLMGVLAASQTSPKKLRHLS